VGIAEEHLPKLFEPFTQVDSSVARRQGGTGLGLSLVRRLAELHGGTVGVASRPGTGSRFCVWLPYRGAELRRAMASRPAG
jgi:signal transduction histidine kinase